MKGLLIINGFVREESFLKLRCALESAAEKRGVDIDVRPHSELLFDASSCRPLFNVSQYGFGILWDKDVRLGMQLERMGLRLFNSAHAVEICDDKFLTHAALAPCGLPMPRTISVPMTYPFVGYGDMRFLESAADELGFPMIIKECHGSFGKQVYLANSLDEARDIIAAHEATPMILQEFVKSSLGRDMRLYVIGRRVAAAMIRSNENDFRANIANGGTSLLYSPTKKEEALALRAAELLGLDFAGVDMLFGERGPLLCEVNSNAHFHGLSQCSGVDIAGGIIDHIAKEMHFSEGYNE